MAVIIYSIETWSPFAVVLPGSGSLFYFCFHARHITEKQACWAASESFLASRLCHHLMS
jgi:hypothetical protein